MPASPAKPRPFGSRPTKTGERVIAINVTGVVLLLPRGHPAHAPAQVRAHREHRLHRRQGRQSEHDRLFGDQGRGHRLTKSLGKEVALDGICVNAVAPPWFGPRFSSSLRRAQIELHDATDPHAAARASRRRSRRWCTFLASPDCSFVTGQCYDASGGRATSSRLEPGASLRARQTAFFLSPVP